MSKIVYLEVSTDTGKTWTDIAKLDLEDVIVIGGLQIRVREEQTTTTTTSTTLPTTTTTTTTSSTTAAPTNVYTLSAPSNGILTINGGYKPGDTIQLRGKITYLQITNLVGTAENPIHITNYPGEVVFIGNPAWNGSGYATAMAMGSSHHVKIHGESKDKFVFTGSTQAKRTAYNSVYISQLTDNIEIYNWTLINGGTGFVCKTDPTTDPRTYGTGTVLSNFSFHDFEVYGTLHEGLYIGHTATYWDLTANAPFYNDPSTMDPTHKYVEPLKLRNVKIFNGHVHDVGYDGIQTAACDNIEIYKNIVENYAMSKTAGHTSGICSGGKNSNAYIHDNIVRKGGGEFMYIFGTGLNGAAYHRVTNNFFYENTNNADGITIRGTDQLVVQIINNTVAATPGNLIRVNSYFEKGTKPPMIISKNLLIKPVSGGGAVYPKNYIYLENGATATESSNYKFATLTAAGFDASYNRLPTSPVPLGIGYQPTL